MSVTNLPDSPDPANAIIGAVLAASLGAYFGQRLAHGYAIKRQKADRQEARRDSLHDDGRAALDAALEVIANEQKRLGELRATTWNRRNFFRDEVADSLTVDKARHSNGAQIFNEDQTKSIDTRRVVSDLRPRLELYLQVDGPTMLAYQSLPETWKTEAFNMLTFDENATTEAINDQVTRAQDAIKLKAEAFGAAARAYAHAHAPAEPPSLKRWRCKSKTG